MRKILLLISLSSFLYVPGMIAHELRTEVIMQSPVVIVKSSYGEGEYVSYAEVTIYSPSDESNEFQNGRTDAKGAFAFMPDRAGTWIFIVDDEIGHRKELRIIISKDFFKTAEASSSQNNKYSEKALILSNAPLILKIAIGLCLIFGLTGIFYWIKANRLIRKGKQ